MKKTIISLKHIAIFCLLTGMASCTNLEENVVDEVLTSGTLTSENAIASAYGQLGNSTFVSHGSVWGLQEYPTDEALLATRGSDWGDGGKWRAMHEFTWDAASPVVTSTWNDLNLGITKTLTAISIINGRNDSNKSLFLAEAKGLLNFYLYTTLDLFNQAPYRDPLNPGAELEVLRGEQYIDTLIKDTESLLPSLADIRTNGTHAGRFTKQAAYALLADMYLNRAVIKNRTAATFNFTEPALDGKSSDMDRVVYYTSLLIDSGKFALESNYFKNFSINNSSSTEMIFSVVQIKDNLRPSSNNFTYMSMERNQKPSPDNRGTNATSTTPEFYATWNGNHDDPRFQRHYRYDDGTWFMNDGTDDSVPATSLVQGTGKPWFHFNYGFMVGQQYGPKLKSDGTFEMTNGRIKVYKLNTEKNTTLPMDFTPELNFDNPQQAVLTQAQINRGVRVFKYEFDPGFGNNGTSNVDIPLYRLGGIYTMRAEAYYRLGNTGAALADLNMLRTSRQREALYNNVHGQAISSVNETTLYNEIGYEMYWEAYRRKQMIRLGKFEQAGTAKPQSQPFRRIFPIPQSTLDASGRIQQNPNY